MVAFIDDFVSSVLGWLIGGTSSEAVQVAALVLIAVMVLAFFLGGVPLEVAVGVIAPLVVTYGVNGHLPPFVIGIAVIFWAVSWTGIIMGMTGQR